MVDREQGTAAPERIAEAARRIGRHGAVLSVEGQGETPDGGWRLVAELAVPLPSRARAAGISRTGVRSMESLFLDFSPRYPYEAPVPLLRADFPRTFPHINPVRSNDELIRPCVYQGSLTDLMLQQGLEAIIDQAVGWLRDAAADNLIDLNQGWEPIRRDESAGTLTFDAQRVRAAARRKRGVAVFQAWYLVDSSGYLIGRVCSAGRPDRAGATMRFTQAAKRYRRYGYATGDTAVFLVWADETDGQGHSLIDDRYQPDTVFTLPDLCTRLQSVGADPNALIAAIRRMLAQARSTTFSWPYGFLCFVVLAVRRPVNVIGTASPVELVPYAVRFDALPRQDFERDARLEPVFHLSPVSPDVLARTSGFQTTDRSRLIVHVGCGSLGSKVILHLARAGFGHCHLIDKDVMGPHNLARHALLDVQPELFPSKARLMKEKIQQLGYADCRDFHADFVRMLLADRTQLLEAVPPETALLVDCSASLPVFEALCAVPLHSMRGRVVRVALYANARVGVTLLEGEGRAPRLDDLAALFFARCLRDEALRRTLADEGKDADRLFVGQNCNSFTVTVDDAAISMPAAFSAAQLQRWLKDGFPPEGQLIVSRVGADGIELASFADSLGPTHVLAAREAGGWEVRILSQVAAAIDADVAKWGELETGGALIGHVASDRRVIVIAGLVPAPDDSVRARDRFVLGTNGLEETLLRVHADSVGYLHFIGTWHSHPRGGGASRIDEATLGTLARLAGSLPVIGLIWTPGGFLCRTRT